MLGNLLLHGIVFRLMFILVEIDKNTKYNNNFTSNYIDFKFWYVENNGIRTISDLIIKLRVTFVTFSFTPAKLRIVFL